ncbi:RING-H2 finger protein ATL74-like [Phoenix dactylifera]|uniref:RING-H2 finger protein ATL74-like n=1 Tax=Phoenix dactylifera TaxID=42345 RepID=A0A8B7CYR8_PHODC|nr:RING-H2 finger protein ATL74-like [Phoenix dactylifera]
MLWPLPSSSIFSPSLPSSLTFIYLSLLFPSPTLMEEPYVSNCHNLSLSILSPTHSPTTPPRKTRGEASLDYDVVVILAAMICALVCALGLNSMLQCVLRCTRRALTEPVGWVAHRRMNAGLRREDVIALPVATYIAPPPPSSGSPAPPPPGCAICLSDFANGEKIRVLPACSHRFHVGCIDTWLLSRCSCPTCRHRLSSHSTDPPLEIAIAP